MKQFDYMICGQGLAGSMLAFQLIQQKKSVLVIDNGFTGTSSHIAAGMFTPISGKRMVKSWMIDTLYPVMLETYSALETLLNTRFLHKKNIQLSFSSVKEQNDFYSSLDDHINPYIVENIEPNKGLQAPFGAVEINQSGWLNTSVFLHAFRQYLLNTKSFLEIQFEYERLSFRNAQWVYDETIVASHMIFCQGYHNRSNPFFGHIPVIENKGDVFLLECNVLDGDKIYKRGAYVVEQQAGIFKAGSTYKWNVADTTPTKEGYDELKEKTDALINGAYTIRQHFAGIRPTTKDRRPILGKHATETNMYIFNGLGTKGVMLAPYFSKLMADFMISGDVPEQEINSSRFEERK